MKKLLSLALILSLIIPSIGNLSINADESEKTSKHELKTKEESKEDNKTYQKKRREDIRIPDHIYDKAVIRYDEPFFSGFPDGSFKPDKPISRAEMATVLTKILGIHGDDLCGYEYFSDIKGHWAINNILLLSDSGLIKGYPDGTFNPNGKMKRSEICSIIYEYWQNNGFTPTFKKFEIKDTDGHWAHVQINCLYNLGLVNITGDKRFRPNDFLTRKEVARILNRLTDRKLGKNEEAIFDDVPEDHPFFEEINAAAGK